MKCRSCQTKLKTTNTRLTHENQHVWRRKHCPTCDVSITTYERPDLHEITVSKKNGAREPFTRDKLLRSLVLSNSADTDVTALTDTIIKQIVDLNSLSITSNEIATHTLATLKRYSKEAYLRYASYHTELLD